MPDTAGDGMDSFDRDFYSQLDKQGIVFDERYNSSAIVNAFGGRYYEPSPDREVYVGLTIGAGVR